MQIVAYLIGVTSIALLIRPSSTSSRLIVCGLAALWVWTGVAYHGFQFSRINGAAYAFAVLFALQGLLLIQDGFSKRQLQYRACTGPSAAVGGVLIVYAMVIYPLVGLGGGYRHDELPAFGITPCPLTLFTTGLFLLASAPVPRWLLVIPVMWSLIGGSAAFLQGVPLRIGHCFSVARRWSSTLGGSTPGRLRFKATRQRAVGSIRPAGRRPLRRSVGCHPRAIEAVRVLTRRERDLAASEPVAALHHVDDRAGQLQVEQIHGRFDRVPFKERRICRRLDALLETRLDEKVRPVGYAIADAVVRLAGGGVRMEHRRRQRQHDAQVRVREIGQSRHQPKAGETRARVNVQVPRWPCSAYRSKPF